MVNVLRGRSSKYTAYFKKQLVRESRAAGASVPMVGKRHGVPANRIYSWRSDSRFQPDGTESRNFTPVDIIHEDNLDVNAPLRCTTPEPQTISQIEITLENGHKLSVSGGADAGFF
ncbi:MAG: transposase [Flavobacteriaceae bacterium]|jgi:transposase